MKFVKKRKKVVFNANKTYSKKDRNPLSSFFCLFFSTRDFSLLLLYQTYTQAIESFFLYFSSHENQEDFFFNRKINLKKKIQSASLRIIQ